MSLNGKISIYVLYDELYMDKYKRDEYLSNNGHKGEIRMEFVDNGHLSLHSLSRNGDKIYIPTEGCIYNVV